MVLIHCTFYVATGNSHVLVLHSNYFNIFIVTYYHSGCPQSIKHITKQSHLKSQPASQAINPPSLRSSSLLNFSSQLDSEDWAQFLLSLLQLTKTYSSNSDCVPVNCRVELIIIKEKQMLYYIFLMLCNFNQLT